MNGRNVIYTHGADGQAARAIRLHFGKFLSDLNRGLDPVPTYLNRYITYTDTTS